VSGHTLEAEREETLVALAQGGDEAAFTKLYDRYFDRVYRYAYYRVGRAEDAEDVTQRVFLRAWRALGSYRQTGSSMLAWLLTIAHNESVNHQRRNKAVHYLEYDLPETRLEADPEHMAEIRLEQARVRRAVLQLKPEQQQVVTMRFLENLDVRDVAAAMGKSEVNVRVIQHRALEQLRKMLMREEK
jgi:RNA polymerase sigma-70 factor (ECF subfamily)